MRQRAAVALGQDRVALHDHRRVRRAESRLVGEQCVDEVRGPAHGSTLGDGAPCRRVLYRRWRETGRVTDAITFYLDPMCPYSYQTSVWIREVRSRLADGLDIVWKFFSLEEVNLEAGKKHPWER